MQTSSSPLENVVQRLQAVMSKRVGLAVALWGDAGIGKSYQVQQLLQTLTCRSSSLHATTPLAALARGLPKPKKLPLWAERTLARLAQSEEIENVTTIASLGAVFAGLAPFVLHLEDIHEAGSERLEFIHATSPASF